MMLLYILSFITLVYLAFLLLFSKFSFSKISEAKTQKSHGVSVLICCKNEAENLRTNLPLFLAQDHPTFEIVLINDNSTDDTLEVMEQFMVQDTRVRVVDVKPNETFWASKKYALTLGIKRAEYKRMLFTDADCKPASNQWISAMSAGLDGDIGIALGYGGYHKTKGFLNKIIRFETVMTALQYFSYASAKMPYMGVGRNLAYTSPVYYSVNGFISHIKVPSGDDDLFINEAATGTNTVSISHPQSFTISSPKTSYKAWFNQKRRHITTATRYKSKHKLLLGLYSLSRITFWGLITACYIFSDWKITTIILIFKLIVDYIVIGKAAKKLEENDLVYFIPFYDLFLLLFQMIIFISNKTSKPATWK